MKRAGVVKKKKYQPLTFQYSQKSFCFIIKVSASYSAYSCKIGKPDKCLIQAFLSDELSYDGENSSNIPPPQ